MGIMKEFKGLMFRRRLIDLAGGTVVGVAFGKLVFSLVDDLILPPISALTSGSNLANLSFVIKKSAAGLPPVAINYGRFAQTAVDFAIVTIAVSMVLQAVDAFADKEEVKPSNEERLLSEIKDLLAARVGAAKKAPPVS